MTDMDTRELAFKTIYSILEEGKPSHVVLQDNLDGSGFDRRDRAFVTRLTEGVVEQLIFLDFCIDEVSKVKVKKQKPVMRNALRLGVYQLLFMDSVPDSAAVNETVKLVRKKGLSGLSGFANGVLRNIAREKEKLVKKSEKNISVKYSCPEWICNYFTETYGNETAERILRGLQRNPDMTVRVNLSKTSVAELTESLRQKGLTVRNGVHHPYALILSDVDNLSELSDFTSGLFQVQDESSMFVCEKAGIKAGDTVIDVCAAPGGKTLHAADIISSLNGQGKVIARDISESKIGLIRDNIERSGFTCIETEVHDALDFDEKLLGKADVVLCDAPCSGLGIIAKKPDIKYNMTAEKQEELARLQRQILSVVCRYVKPGGTLMYSTCTINTKENEDNVRWFCGNFDFTLVEQRQLLPGIDGCDGFFFSKLVKNI